MGDTHPLVIAIFFVLLALATYSHLTARVPGLKQSRHQLKVQKRRSDPVWKDRGGC